MQQQRLTIRKVILFVGNLMLQPGEGEDEYNPNVIFYDSIISLRIFAIIYMT